METNVMENKDLEQLLELEEIDLFLSKAKEKCEKKLRGKSFAGMEQCNTRGLNKSIQVVR